MAHIPGFVHPPGEQQPQPQQQEGLLGAPAQPQERSLLQGFTDPGNLALITGGLQFAQTGDIQKALQAASLGIQIGSALQPAQQEPLSASEIAQLSRTFTPESIRKFEQSRNTSDLVPVDEPTTTKITQGSTKRPDGTFESVPVAQKDGQLFLRNPDTNQFDIAAPAGTSIDDTRVAKQLKKDAATTATQQKKSDQASALRDELTRLGVTVTPQRLNSLQAQIGTIKVGANAQTPVNIIRDLAFQEFQAQDPASLQLIDQIGGINPKNPRAEMQRDRLRDRANKVGAAVEKAEFGLTDSALSSVDRALADVMGVDENGVLLGGDIPGLGGGKLLPTAALGDKAAALRIAIQGLENIILKDRSGAAVTPTEAKRLIKELSTGVFSSDRDFLLSYKRLKEIVNKHNSGLLAGFRSQAVELYQTREGGFKPSPVLQFDPSQFGLRAKARVPAPTPGAGGQADILNPNFDLSSLSFTTPGLNPILQKARQRQPLSEAEKRVLRAFKTQTQRGQ